MTLSSPTMGRVAAGVAHDDAKRRVNYNPPPVNQHFGYDVFCLPIRREQQ